MTTFEKIKKLADSHGISIQQLAEANNIGINTIYKWKNYAPKATDLAKIAKYFHVSTDYLIGNSDNPNVNTDTTDISWIDLDMPYGGKIPDELKSYYKALAQQYVKDHPEILGDKHDR